MIKSNILIAQTLEEFKFILSKTKKDEFICLPLTLEIQLYCELNNIKYFKLIKLLKKNFHKEGLLTSEKLIKNLKFGDLKFKSQKEIYRSLIRFKFNSMFLLIKSIEEIKKKYKIEKVFLSGWHSYEKQYSYNNYFLSFMVKSLFKNLKVKQFSNNKLIMKKSLAYNYKLKNYELLKNGKYVLLNNLGYNFNRLLLYLYFNRYKTVVPIIESDTQISKLHKFFYKLLGVRFLYLVKDKVQKKINFYIPKIKFKYNKKSFADILNYFREQEIGNHYSLYSQIHLVNKLYDRTQFKFIFVNFCRGLSGYFIEKGIKNKIKSFCIPHGTVTNYFNIYGKLYNKAISDTLFYNGNLTIISQSSLANNFKNKFGYKNKFIDTGNLIFASPALISLKKKKILYAVTNRDFKNSHFYGIENFYEFYDNLITLNNLAKMENLDIVVKPHSSEYKSIKLLEKKFKYLTFSTEKISKALKFCFVTVSFSSTVIEDSLNSKIPVILFDRWKRYKHCDSESNPYKKNSAVYYLNTEKDFVQCIKTIKLSNKINFKKYVKEPRFLGYLINFKTLFKRIK